LNASGVVNLQLKELVPADVFELFQMKLRDWNLMMDPLFRWCAYVCIWTGVIL